MPTKIRPAKPDDREELTRMRLELQDHLEARNPDIWRLTPEGRENLSAQIDEMLQDEAGILLVAETDSPCGYIYGRVSRRTTLTPETVGFIYGIFVDGHERRKGTATRLVRELCDRFAGQDVDEVNLNYVVGNTEAEALWRSLGLTPVIHIANTPLEDIRRRLGEKPI